MRARKKVAKAFFGFVFPLSVGAATAHPWHMTGGKYSRIKTLGPLKITRIV